MWTPILDRKLLDGHKVGLNTDVWGDASNPPFGHLKFLAYLISVRNDIE